MLKLLPFLLATAAAAQVTTAPLVGVVVDPDGAPVARAEVVVRRSPGRGFRCLDLQLRNTWIEVARTRTDSRGRFGVQLPIGLALRVDVDHAPHARWCGEDVVPGDELRIELQRPCSVRGTLTFADDGRATTGSVRAWDDRHVEVFAGRTDDRGAFSFDRVPAGTVHIEVIPDRAMTPAVHDTTLTADSPYEHAVRLERGVELRGVVVDAATGAPIAGAGVGEGWAMRKATRTDAKGEYVLPGHGEPDRPDLHCRADGYVEQRVDRPAKAEPWTLARFELHRGADFTGRVLDPDGKPRADAYVAVVSMNRLTVPWLPARTAEGGTFTCTGLPALSEAVLLVRCDGFASAAYALPTATEAGLMQLPAITLHRARLLRGVLRDENGEPVPHQSVTLHGANADCEQLAALPSNWNVLRFYLAQRTTRTDARGAFAFGDLAPGNYELALGDGNVDNRAVPVPVDVSATGEPAPVELVMRGSGLRAR